MMPESAARVVDQYPPDDWREAELRTVADVHFSSVDKLIYPSEQPVRLCNYIDVYKNDYITGGLEFMRASATQPEIDRFGLEVGDVIITKDSETPDDIGVPAVVDYAAPDLVCGYHLGLIRRDKSKVDPTFLAKQIGHHRIARYFGRQANGLTRYGLPIGAVERTLLWLPNPDEQRAVGNIFRLVDAAIAKTEAVIAKLKQVRAGLLHDILTCGLDEHGQLRDPIAHPEQFQDSPLGPIPNGWQVLSLETLATVDRGKFTHRPRNDPAFYGGEFPFIQTGDVALAGDDPITGASQTLSRRGVEASKEFPAGTIAVTIAANIGDTAILGCPMYFPDSVVGVVVSELHSVRWIELALRRSKRTLNALAPQSAQKNINLTFLRPLLLPVPEPHEQRRCSEAYERVSAHIKAEGESLRKLAALRLGLMADLLTGRVRVPENLGGAGPIDP